jgi:predicted dehydrogenase
LLDGGVHFAAALRLMLSGGGEKIKSLSAFTTQLQSHLRPVDTLNSIMQLTSSASGTFAVSFGTTDKGSEYLVACENGSVHVSMGKVTVKKGGEVVEEKEFKDEGAGVKQEVRAWAESLGSGKWRKEQSGDEALGDLEIIESALKSGEDGGRTVVLEHQ